MRSCFVREAAELRMKTPIDLDEVPEKVRPRVAQIKRILTGFHRHFAGRPRPTCDPLLLADMVKWMETLVAGLGDSSELSEIRSEAASRLSMLETELEQMGKGGDYSIDDRSTFLAARANAQFASYARHFAHRARVTRRPGLAQLMVASLGAILAEMEEPSFDDLEDPARHRANIAIARTELARVREEARLIAEEVARADIDERIRALGVAANDEFAEYREHFAGKERISRDQTRLGDICDRLAEIERQMIEIAAESDDTVNLANLRIVMKNLEGYERVYLEIAHRRAHAMSLADLVRSAPSLRAEIDRAEAVDDGQKEAALSRLEALLDDPLIRRLTGMD